MKLNSLRNRRNRVALIDSIITGMPTIVLRRAADDFFGKNLSQPILMILDGSHGITAAEALPIESWTTQKTLFYPSLPSTSGTVVCVRASIEAGRGFTPDFMDTYE